MFDCSVKFKRIRMQAALSQKVVVPTAAIASAKPARSNRHVVMAVNGADRCDDTSS